MRRRVNHSDEFGPPDRWNKAYDSFKTWLNTEAPVASPLVHRYLTEEKRRLRFRIIRRKR